MMTNAPVLSVVIPCRNCRSTITATLQSLRIADKSSLEVIFIDDGSNDDSTSVAANVLGQINTPHSVLSQSGSGLGAARNTGIEVARGDWLVFLDADDLIQVNSLVRILRRTNEAVDMLLFDTQPFADHESRLTAALPQKERYYKRRNKLTTRVLNGQESLERQILLGAYLPTACLFAVRRNHLALHNITFVEGIIHEDLAFTFQCTALARGVKYVQRALHSRRLRSGSITDQTDPALSIHGHNRAIEEIVQFAAAKWEQTPAFLSQLIDFYHRRIRDLQAKIK